MNLPALSHPSISMLYNAYSTVHFNVIPTKFRSYVMLFNVEAIHGPPEKNYLQHWWAHCQRQFFLVKLGDMVYFRFLKWQFFKTNLPEGDVFPSNKNVLDLYEEVKTLYFDILADTADCKSAVTYFIPKVRSGPFLCTVFPICKM